MPVSGQDKTVAPLRIRISTRKSNKKRTDDDDGDSRDSDAEFEKLLVQQETFLDEADHEKEEKRMSRYSCILYYDFVCLEPLLEQIKRKLLWNKQGKSRN